MRRIILVVLALLGLGTAPAEAKDRTAAEVVAELRKVLPSAVGAVTVFTAESDPNELLGRPGGYLSKAHWADKRVKTRPGDETASIELGGGVEVFGSEREAKRRASYILDIVKAAPELAGVQYVYQRSKVVLRVSGRLSPTQAKEYEAALKKAV